MSEDRYLRQIRLSSFGSAGQSALQNAKVLIVGCGGLGCPVALYLSRAGVKEIGLVDGDKVDITNLHRQVLFNETDIGELKAEAAQNALLHGDESLNIEVFIERLQPSNYESIINGYDIVVDCTDNFETRYLLNDACILLDKPLVYGAANGWEGQVAVFNLKQSGNLRDLYPEVPTQGTIQNCEEAGVLGVITGIIGSMMALEVIKVATGIGNPFLNQLVQYDGETNQFHNLKYSANTSTRNVKIDLLKQIDWETYHRSYTNAVLVDIRTASERKANFIESLHVPVEKIPNWIKTFDSEQQVVFFCETGQRALQASRTAFSEANIRTIAVVDTITK